MPTVTADGLQWVIDEDGVDGQLGPTNHEAELAPYFVADGVFLDVGADVGRWTVRVAQDPEARIFAFEPYGPRRERLVRNLEVNGVTNATVMDFGLADRFCTETLGRTGHLGDDGVPVALVPLDAVWPSEHDRIGLVKLDIEGWEAKALRGMVGILASDRPRLMIEMHDRLYGQHIRDECLEVLGAQRYRWRVVASLGGQDYYYCEVA